MKYRVTNRNTGKLPLKGGQATLSAGETRDVDLNEVQYTMTAATGGVTIEPAIDPPATKATTDPTTESPKKRSKKEYR